MTTVYSSSQTGFLNMAMTSPYLNGLCTHQISRACLNECLWHVAEREVQITATAWCYHVSMVQNIWFPHLVEHMPWRIKAFLKVKKVQPGMSKAYLMNWPLSFCVRISLNANCLEWLFRSNWYIFLSIDDKKLLESHFPHTTKMYSNCFFQVHKVYSHIFTYERQEPEDIWYFSV